MKKGKFTGSLKLYAKRLVTGTLALSLALGFTPGLTAKAATASDIAIVLDGETTDWDYIKKFVVDEDGFSQAAAFVTDDALYVMRELSDATGWGNDHIFIDADGDHKNGCYNAGIDFMLEGTDLYYYTGSGGDFGWGGSQPKDFFRSTDGVIAEYKFPLDSLGVKAPVVKDDIRVHIGCLDSNWGSLCDYPAGSTTLVKAPTLEEAFVSSDAPAISDFDITANGSLKAISTETMPGGTVAFFSAKGGNGEYKYNFASSKTYGKDNSRFVIEGNKLVVKDRLLAPGTYYVYVKVSSDIRSEKKAFVIEIDAADKTTVVNESIFSGQDGQWFAVNHNTANSTPNLTELKAATDGYNLYAYLKAEALSDEAEIFVSTSDSGKNMSEVWDDGKAVDFKVSANDGTVYKYVNGDWASVGSAAISKSKTQAEIQIPLDLLGKTEGDFLVGARDVKDGEEGYLPNTGNTMLYCVTPNMSAPPAITVDGNSDDWVAAGLDNLRVAHGSGSVGDLYAFRDAENVYAMTTITVGEGGWNNCYAVSTNFLINADGNPKTGCQHATIKESGFEFLIQDWNSNDVGDVKKNVEAFIYTGTTGDHHQIAESANGGPCYKVYSPEGGDKVTVEWYLPISLMQRTMDESDCGAVSDDLYVAVDRSDPGLQAGTEAGSASDGSRFALIPKYQVKLNLSIDGNFADWDSISNKAYNTSADTTCNLQATKSADRLYTLVTNGEGLLNTVNLYYISTGKDTGYSFSTYNNIDYIVRDAELFPVIADNEIGESLGAVWMNYYHDSLEMQLYLSQIGNPDRVEIAWRGIDGTYAIPADGLMAVTATCELGKDAGYYYPTEDFSSFGNPYKGWVGWAGEFVSNDGKPTSAQKYESGDQMFERSAVYLAVRWREYEPTKGKYDFDSINKKYNLDFWINKGVRINLRFVMDNPEGLGVENAKDYGVVVNKSFIEANGLTGSNAEKALNNLLAEGLYRMDIPNWLFLELCEQVMEGKITDAGTFYYKASDLGGGGFSPNYYAESVIEYHDSVIKEMAKDFDKNEMTAFVQIGSLGHWAEIHTWPEGTGVFPNPTTCNRYMESYTNYFHNVKVGLRKPYPYAAEHRFGLFNDIFGAGYLDGLGTSTFLGYINNGDVDMPDSDGDEVAASKMPDFWMYNYSGGEFSDGDPTRHLNNDTIVETINEIRYTHVSWLGPCSPCDMEYKDIWANVYRANVLAAQKAMGYNYVIEKISQVSNVTAGQDTPINFVVNNEGVAPFYYDWPLEFSLIKDNGEVAYTQTLGAGIRSWLPGRTSVDVNLFVSNSVPAGEYTLAIGIANKDTKEPAIRLAMQGGRDDLRYPLYKINLSSTGSASSDPKPSVPTGGGASAGADAGASATEGTYVNTPSTETTTPATTETTAPAANTTGAGTQTGNAGRQNATVNTEPATTEETVANAGNVGAETAETIINQGGPALADGLGGEEAPAGNAAEAVAAVEAASGLSVWIIVVAVLAIAAVAGIVIYKNGLRKGGQDNE